MRDPGDESLVYRDSLSYEHEDWFCLWIEPEGWKPVWTKDNDSPFYQISNLPRLMFELRRSSFDSFGMHDEPTRDMYLKGQRDRIRPPEHTWDDEIVVATAGAIWTSWNADDKEAESFCRKVFRIAKKFMTNKFRGVDDETLLPYRKATTTSHHHWAGHHAMRWAAERRHNYLCGYFKPPDYDFGDDEPPE